MSVALFAALEMSGVLLEMSGVSEISVALFEMSGVLSGASEMSAAVACESSLSLLDPGMSGNSIFFIFIFFAAVSSIVVPCDWPSHFLSISSLSSISRVADLMGVILGRDIDGGCLTAFSFHFSAKGCELTLAEVSGGDRGGCASGACGDV